MLLAIDTATKWTGVALHDGQTVTAEFGWRSTQNQTVELAPTVADILRRSGLKATDLAAIAVAIGPGSYTGLRIGLGFAKGLSLANGTRLIGVPTLDILAAGQPRFDGPLLAIAEAGRTRVCVARYRWLAGRGWHSEEKPAIERWEDLLASIDGPALLAGEITPAAAKLIRATKKELSIAPPADTLRRAGHLAVIGWQRLRRGQIDDPASLVPVYTRSPAGTEADKD